MNPEALKSCLRSSFGMSLKLRVKRFGSAFWVEDESGFRGDNAY